MITPRCSCWSGIFSPASLPLVLTLLGAVVPLRAQNNFAEVWMSASVGNKPNVVQTTTPGGNLAASANAANDRTANEGRFVANGSATSAVFGRPNFTVGASAGTSHSAYATGTLFTSSETAAASLRLDDELYFSRPDGTPPTEPFEVTLAYFTSSVNIELTPNSTGLLKSASTLRGNYSRFLRFYTQLNQTTSSSFTETHGVGENYVPQSDSFNFGENGSASGEVRLTVNPGEKLFITVIGQAYCSTGGFFNLGQVNDRDGYSTAATAGGSFRIRLTSITSSEGVQYAGSASGLVYVDAPTPPPVGTFCGLLSDGELNAFAQFSFNRNGRMTGFVNIEGRRIAVRGQSANGVLDTAFALRGVGAGQIRATLPTEAGDPLPLEVDFEGMSFSGTAYPEMVVPRGAQAPFEGVRRTVYVGSANLPELPVAELNFTFNRSAKMLVAGRLPDGTRVRVSQKLVSIAGEPGLVFFGNISASPEYRLRRAFLQAPPRNGVLLGEVSFDENGEPEWLPGDLLWIRGRLDPDGNEPVPGRVEELSEGLGLLL